MRALMPDHADAIVIGGGPAGCTTAILLKQYNPSARIIIFEKERFPRHHIGESTLPDANAVLHKLGVIDAINRAGFPIKSGLTYKWRHDRPIFADVFSQGVHPNLQDRLYPKGIPDHSWQVERGRYDSILLDRAREVGIDVRERHQVVDAVSGEGETGDRVLGVCVRGEHDATPRRVMARHTIDASGQARVLSRWLGVPTDKFALGDTALYRYYGGFTWREDLIGSLFNGRIFFTSVPRGWMWFIPLSADTVSVGLVTKKDFLRGVTPDRAFEEELGVAAEIREMLGDAVQIGHPYSTGAPATYAIQDWSYRNREFAGPGWYLAGDAAAFVDPILSSGLNLAHNCGLLAANAINTEWNFPEISGTAVRAAYASMYREIYASFLAMATWWYERRHTDLADWWKVAREQSRNPSAIADLSDRQVFLTFTAGYVTDFRFINVGAGGFGAQGLNYIFDNLPDEPIAEKLYRPTLAADTPLLPMYDGYEFGTYYGSHVGTNRWWQLPRIDFRRGDRRVPFYPSIMESESADDGLLVEPSERVARRTLAYLDGRRTANQVARALQGDFGGFDQKFHRCAMKFMHNLPTVDLLRLRTGAAAAAPR